MGFLWEPWDLGKPGLRPIDVCEYVWSIVIIHMVTFASGSCLQIPHSVFILKFNFCSAIYQPRFESQAFPYKKSFTKKFWIQ